LIARSGLIAVDALNADAELDASFGRQAGVALDQAALHLDGAPHRVNGAAELDDAAVSSALDDAAPMSGDSGIHEIAAQTPKARKRAILVCAGESALADDVGHQNRCKFTGLVHSGLPQRQDSTKRRL
jgi:hypothetical protein